jgi:hypothetical protein
MPKDYTPNCASGKRLHFSGRMPGGERQTMAQESHITTALEHAF